MNISINYIHKIVYKYMRKICPPRHVGHGPLWARDGLQVPVVREQLCDSSSLV